MFPIYTWFFKNSSTLQLWTLVEGQGPVRQGDLPGELFDWVLEQVLGVVAVNSPMERPSGTLVLPGAEVVSPEGDAARKMHELCRYYQSGDLPLHLVPGLKLDGSLRFPAGEDEDRNPFDLFVDGDLEVQGVLECHSYDGTNFVVVSGDVRCGDLILGGEIVFHVQGDLIVEGVIVGYNDEGGNLEVKGRAMARAVVSDNFELGEVSSTDPTPMKDAFRREDGEFDGGRVAEAVRQGELLWPS